MYEEVPETSSHSPMTLAVMMAVTDQCPLCCEYTFSSVERNPIAEFMRIGLYSVRLVALRL